MPEPDSQEVVEVPEDAWVVIQSALRCYEDDNTSRDGGEMARTALTMIELRCIGKQQEAGGQNDGSSKQTSG